MGLEFKYQCSKRVCNFYSLLMPASQSELEDTLMKILFKSVMTQRRLMRAATASVFNIQIYLFKLFCWQSPMFIIVQDVDRKMIIRRNFISLALMLSCKVEICKTLPCISKSLYIHYNSFMLYIQEFLPVNDFLSDTQQKYFNVGNMNIFSFM